MTYFTMEFLISNNKAVKFNRGFLFSGSEEESFEDFAEKKCFLGNEERKKRPRTAFTATQIKSLESEFERNKYLSVAKRLQLSKLLNLTETQVQYNVPK